MSGKARFLPFVLSGLGDADFIGFVFSPAILLSVFCSGQIHVQTVALSSSVLSPRTWDVAFKLKHFRHRNYKLYSQIRSNSLQRQVETRGSRGKTENCLLAGQQPLLEHHQSMFERLLVLLPQLQAGCGRFQPEAGKGADNSRSESGVGRRFGVEALG